MSDDLQTAFVGDQVELVVDALGAPDGDAVQFRVLAPGGEIARLTGTVQSGAVRAPWRVDVGQEPLPAVLSFVAARDGEEVQSAALEVHERPCYLVEDEEEHDVGAAPQLPKKPAGLPRLLWSLNYSAQAQGWAAPAAADPDLTTAVRAMVQWITQRALDWPGPLDKLMNDKDGDYAVAGLSGTEEEWARLCAKVLTGVPYCDPGGVYGAGWPARITERKIVPVMCCCQQSVEAALRLGGFTKFGIACDIGTANLVKSQAGARWQDGDATVPDPDDPKKLVAAGKVTDLGVGAVLVMYSETSELDRYFMPDGHTKVGNAGHAKIILRKDPSKAAICQYFETGGPPAGEDMNDYGGVCEKTWGTGAINSGVSRTDPLKVIEVNPGPETQQWKDKLEKNISNLQDQISALEQQIKDADQEAQSGADQPTRDRAKARAAQKRRELGNEKPPSGKRADLFRAQQELKQFEKDHVISHQFSFRLHGAGAVWDGPIAPLDANQVRTGAFLRLVIRQRQGAGHGLDAQSIVFRSSWIWAAQALKPLPISQLAFSLRNAPGCATYEATWEVNADNFEGAIARYPASDVYVLDDGRFNSMSRLPNSAHPPGPHRKFDAADRGPKGASGIAANDLLAIDKLVKDLSPTPPAIPGPEIAHGAFQGNEPAGAGWKFALFKDRLFAWWPSPKPPGKNPNDPQAQDSTVRIWEAGSGAQPLGVLRSNAGWGSWGEDEEIVYLGKPKTAGVETVLHWKPSTGEAEAWSYKRQAKGADEPLSANPIRKAKWTTIGTGDRILWLGPDFERALVWTAGSAKGRVYPINLAGNDILPNVGSGPLAEFDFSQKLGGKSRLTWVGGGQMIAWDPSTREYQVFRYDGSRTGNADFLPELLAQGTLPGQPPPNTAQQLSQQLIFLGADRLMMWNQGAWELWRYERP